MYTETDGWNVSVCGKWVGRDGNLLALSDIYGLGKVGTSHLSQQRRWVQSTNIDQSFNHSQTCINLYEFGA
jgi:hypothetical protein